MYYLNLLVFSILLLFNIFPIVEGQQLSGLTGTNMIVQDNE